MDAWDTTASFQNGGCRSRGVAKGPRLYQEGVELIGIRPQTGRPDPPADCSRVLRSITAWVLRARGPAEHLAGGAVPLDARGNPARMGRQCARRHDDDRRRQDGGPVGSVQGPGQGVVTLPLILLAWTTAVAPQAPLLSGKVRDALIEPLSAIAVVLPEQPAASGGWRSLSRRQPG